MKTDLEILRLAHNHITSNPNSHRVWYKFMYDMTIPEAPVPCLIAYVGDVLRNHRNEKKSLNLPIYDRETCSAMFFHHHNIGPRVVSYFATDEGTTTLLNEINNAIEKIASEEASLEEELVAV